MLRPDRRVFMQDLIYELRRIYLTRRSVGSESLVRSVPLLGRRPERRGSVAQTVLYFRYCIEAQNRLRLSSRANLLRTLLAHNPIAEHERVIARLAPPRPPAPRPARRRSGPSGCRQFVQCLGEVPAAYAHPRLRNYMQRSYTVWSRVWAHAHLSAPQGSYARILFWRCANKRGGQRKHVPRQPLRRSFRCCHRRR